MITIRKAIFTVAFASLLCLGLSTAANADLGLTSYFVRLYNVDDEARLYINGQLILTKYFNESEEIDLFAYLTIGDNELRLEVINNGKGWTYGWEIKRDDNDSLFDSAYTIYNDQCGSVGIIGCMDNDQRTGNIHRETFLIKYTG